MGLDQYELRDNIEMISRQVMRMSSVIQNIRNFARDDVSPEFTDVLVNDAVENVFSMIGRQLEAHNITVEKKLAGNLPAVQAPVNRLEQVVTNLLINARQAFDSCQHHDWRIWISSELREGAVVLEVGDNATGIPEDIIKRIFYPFFTTKSVGKGTGLGLSISQSIVASMKGKLEVKNNEWGGATFEVRIPV
ncbi:MAG: GHKL domain-containing protein [Desulfuromonadales bacterium]|nr:GHKL domain-containing protein [Desulfuromonadales bacterium]